MGLTRPVARFGVLLVLGAVMAVIVVPTLVVAVGSVWSAPFINQPGHLTLDNYAQVLTSNRALQAGWSTIQMTLGASAVALTLGGFQAWVIARTNVPFKAVLRWIPVAPLLLSALVANTGFIALYSAQTGIFNAVVMSLFGLENAPVDIYSMPGLILSLGSHLAPISYLVLLAPLMSMGRSLDEASRASGARSFRTLRSVTFPLLRPALLSSFTLTAILASHAFETPLMIGLPVRITTYVSEIYLSITASVSYSQASAQAMVYLLLIGLLLWWNRRVTRVEARFALIAGKDHAAGVKEYDFGRYVLVAAILLINFFSFFSLLGANVFKSLLPYFRLNSPLPPFTLDNYREALASPNVIEALRNSFLLAGIVSLIAVIVATFLAVLAYKTKSRGRRLAEEVGTLPVAFPPLVFSMAMLITILNLPFLSSLYNSVALLVLVLVVVYLPFALRVMSSAVISIDDSLLEASASSGSTQWRTIRSIALPLMATALVGGMALVFIFSFRELGAIALITPPSTHLLPTLIYGKYQVGQLQQVYALNTMTFVVTVLAFVVLSACYRAIARRVSGARQASATGEMTTPSGLVGVLGTSERSQLAVMRQGEEL
jgi:iron(III) transport system permease protein